jgi:hypothetical protein
VRTYRTHLVRVRYLGPTTYQGSRFKATWLDGPGFSNKPLTVSLDYAKELSDQQAELALATCSSCPRRHEVLDYHSVPPNYDTFVVVSCEVQACPSCGYVVDPAGTCRVCWPD